MLVALLQLVYCRTEQVQSIIPFAFGVLGTACHNKCEGMLPYGGLPASVAAVEYAYPRCVRLPEVVRS